MLATRFRKIYNAIDSLFDRSAISHKMQTSRESAGDKRPKTAGQALEAILPAVNRFDRKALLKLIVSQQGIDPQGASAHWEFFFDLVNRQAQLVCEWKLTWDEKADAHGALRIEITVNPFPPTDSPIRQMVRDGQLLHRQLSGMWKQEVQRTPPLPRRFRDTDLAIADFSKQGLDPTLTEFSLRAGRSPEGKVNWIAQTRDKSYFAAFA